MHRSRRRRLSCIGDGMAPFVARGTRVVLGTAWDHFLRKVLYGRAGLRHSPDLSTPKTLMYKMVPPIYIYIHTYICIYTYIYNTCI